MAGEWSFIQTLQYLVLATDAWPGRGTLELAQLFHPLGHTHGSHAEVQGPYRPRNHGARLPRRKHHRFSGRELDAIEAIDRAEE